MHAVKNDTQVFYLLARTRPLVLKTRFKQVLSNGFFMWSPLVRGHLFWPSKVYMSVIITHITHYKSCWTFNCYNRLYLQVTSLLFFTSHNTTACITNLSHKLLSLGTGHNIWSHSRHETKCTGLHCQCFSNQFKAGAGGGRLVRHHIRVPVINPLREHSLML